MKEIRFDLQQAYIQHICTMILILIYLFWGDRPRGRGYKHHKHTVKTFTDPKEYVHYYSDYILHCDGVTELRATGS